MAESLARKAAKNAERMPGAVERLPRRAKNMV